MEWSIYNHLFYSQKAQTYLLYSSLSNMLIELNEDSYKEILGIKDNPNIVNMQNELGEILLDGRFVVQSNKTEINKIILSALSQRFNPTTLSLTIAPTRACNFNCSYCYECDRANKKMSKKTQNALVKFVKQHEDVKFLHVIWYGGEPTLAKATIKYLSDELQKIAKNYSAFMVTNGYCLDKIVDSIELMKISSLQITLDGTKETHNQSRPLLNGNGTFDKILSNLDMIVSRTKVNVNIRMNITTENKNQFTDLYYLLKERYASKVRLYPAFVHNYNGACRADTCYDDSYTKAVFLKDLYEKNSIYTREIYPFRISKGCMVQKLNAFVIGPGGELYKCWHHLGVKEKEIGNILDNRKILDYGKLADMMLEDDSLFDNNCNHCQLFPSCNGGCTDIKRHHENVCIPAKSMLEDFINIHYVVKNNMNMAKQIT